MATGNICILKPQARTSPLFEVHITHVIVLALILRAVDELGGILAEFVFWAREFTMVGLLFVVPQVDTRVVTTRRAIKVQRHSIFSH
jgi:hypothetical protein